MAEAEAKGQGAAEAQESKLTVLDQILTEGRFKSDQEQDRVKDAVQGLVKEILDETVTYKKDIEATLNEQIARIDEIITLQLNEVMHHPKFKKLEASWRGLRYLVAQTEVGPMLKIKVMSLSKEELMEDLTAGKAEMAVDRSNLFNKIYQEEYNQYGGTPYGALIGDYEFDQSGQDVQAAYQSLGAGRSRALPLPVGGIAGNARVFQLHGASERIRAGECLRRRSVRPVEGVQGE